MKKTYIPSIPRSRKLRNVGGGTINVSGGSAQSVPVIEGHTHDNKIILDAITQLHLRILSSLNVDEDGALIVELSNIIKELDTTAPTDENLFSALRTVLEIRARSISKTDPDTAQEIIKFVKGIEIGTFTTGPLGAGAAIKMENGVSRMEVDQLDVRMRATFRELIIESLKHIGGQLILSPARMKCTSVVDGGTYYRCYFDTGDGKVSNEFVAGDQARCQVFTGSGVKMYWRLVTSVGTDWINLSKTDAISGSSIPEAGDDIVQLGNRTDTTRQNAQILSTVGSDAPSWKQYKGINAFSLEGKDTTVFSGTGNKIDGKTVFMSSGANVEDGINSKNSNYSSQPTSYKANDTWTLSSDTTVNGVAYKSGEILTATQDSTTFNQAHWLKRVRYTDDTAVNNLEIGGRNLIIDSENRLWFISNSSANYPIQDQPVSGENYRCFKRTYPEGVTDTLISTYTPEFFTPEKSGYYTYSTYFRPNEFDIELRLRFGSTYGNFILCKADEWTQISVTAWIEAGVNTRLFGVWGEMPPELVQWIDYNRVSVTSGNKATDWSPAPEDVDAKIADTKLYVEYSTDGTSWHTTFQTNDIYMRQKTGVNGTWTGAIKIVGKDGTSVSIKGKVSTSASLPSSAGLGDGYIAEDTGHLWVWTGSWTDAGQIQGDNGANSYIHIAYADDSMGGGFSHNPSGKSWIGIYADFTAIDSDTPSDYTWMYAKGQQGDQGVSISSITPKYAASTDGVNPPTSWSNTVPTKAWNEYMWQYEIIAYSNSTTFETAKRVVSGINGEDGSDGIDGVDGADGISITNVTSEYAVSASSTTAPTVFSTTIPTRPAGQYLWAREKVTYSSGLPSYTAARVVTGDKGDTGASAPLLYLSASAQVMKCNPDNTPQTGQTISIEAKLQNVSGTATFVATPYNDSGTAQTVITLGGTGNTRTLTNSQWLAAYKKIEVVATLGSLTDKVTIYRVSDGATGATGQNAIVGLLTNESVTLQANNAGAVSSFTPANGEFWVYNGVTKVTSGITFSKVSETGCTAAITSAGAYSVSAMSEDNATVVLRAVYSGVTIDKVLTLSKSKAGADGVSITLVDVEFAVNTNPTTAPTTGWTTTAPTLLDGEQLWTRTKTTYSAGNPTYSTPANITPKKGDTGAVGQGVESVTEEYAISASKTVQPTTGWSTTQPAWIQGQYIWSRVKVVYKNPASTVYTGYAVSSEWEAVNNLEIGGRNLVLNSNNNSLFNMFRSGVIPIKTANINVPEWGATNANRIQTTGGTELLKFYGTLIGVNGEISAGDIVSASIHIKNNSVNPIRVDSNLGGREQIISAGQAIKIIWENIVFNNVNPLQVRVWATSIADAIDFVWWRAKAEKGTKATDWTPAPEDVQATIDAEKTRINEILSDNVADPSEKQYLSNLWQEIYAEYPRIWAQANTYAVDKSNYEAKYSALNTLLSPVLANLTTNSTVSGASIRTAFSQYYGEKTFLLNNITNKVNQNAGDAAAVAADAQAKANTAKAITDNFGTQIGGVGFDSALISTVLILLRGLNSIIETAGISGIQGDGYSPSYWSGGTYSQALAFSNLAIALDSGVTPIPSATLNATMANIVHLHNGIAKIGKLIIGSNGNIYTLKNGIVRFELNVNSLPYISSLRDQSEINRTANNTSKSFTINSEEYIFPNSIEVVEDNSTVTVQAQISATAFSDDNPPVNYSTSVFLYLINSDGSTYSTVGFVYAATNSTDTFDVNSKITGVAKGFYKLKAIYTNSSGHYAASGSVGASVMTSQFKVDVSKFMIGENGYMGFYGKNKYIYFNENEDIFFGLRGTTDMPGVLAAGSSTSGGTQTNVWGAKSSTAGVTTITSPSAGFRVPLSGLSHSNYVVQITPHTNTTFRVGTKTSTYFEIYGSGGFDYVVIGKNYA